MFTAWEDFCNKSCSACDCGKKLVGDPPVALAFEDNMWFHEVCLLRAKRAFALASKLAQLGYAIAVYCAARENIDGEQGGYYAK
mgnify:CR=1 FL=1